MGCCRGGKRPTMPRQDKSVQNPNAKKSRKNPSNSSKNLSKQDSAHFVHPNLPTPVNEASMVQLLRECEAANPENFNGEDEASEEEAAEDEAAEDGDYEFDTWDINLIGTSRPRAPDSDHGSNGGGEPLSEPVEVRATSEGIGSSNLRNTRGHARPHVLIPGKACPKVYIYLGELVGDEVSGWFLPEIRFEWQKLWPRWKAVDAEVKERLWNAFKNYFDLCGADESTVRHLFYRKSAKWYREAMSTTKKDALKKIETRDKTETKDVKDLIGTPKPPWMLKTSVWNDFVKHWNDPHTIKVSNSAKRSRATEGAGCHRLGNVGLKARMRKIENATGVCPSPFIILLEQNWKKNKVTGIDEVHNKKFERAWVKYELMFKTRYGDQMDPSTYPPDLQLWDAIEEVSPGRSKGRRLGFGTTIQSNIFNTSTGSSANDSETQKLLDTPNVDQRLITLAIGPRREIIRYKGYYTNGYYFDTRKGAGEMTTYNSGVCVKGSCYADNENIDYFGALEEIWELTYNGLNETVVLFKCYWFDTKKWMQIHPKNGIVQIKHKKRSSKDDPFVLASQAQQVFYLDYVSDDKKHLEWVVATKTYARSRIDWTNIENVDNDNIEFFQEEEQPVPILVQPTLELDNDDLLVAPGLYDDEESNEETDDENDEDCETNDEESDEEY